MLQRTDEQGRYLLMSSLTDELTRGGAKLMAIDPDFGVTAEATSSVHAPGGVLRQPLPRAAHGAEGPAN